MSNLLKISKDRLHCVAVLFYVQTNLILNLLFLAESTLQRISSTVSVYLPCAIRLFFKRISDCNTLLYSSSERYKWYFCSFKTTTSCYSNYIIGKNIEVVCDCRLTSLNEQINRITTALSISKNFARFFLSLAERAFSLAK